MKGPIQAIINGNAGGMAGGDSRRQLTELLQAAFPDAAILFTDEGTDVPALARQAVERGTRMVVAGGGDGTINAVALGLVGTDTVLGVLPLGTLNHFAKDLGYPVELKDAIRILANGTVTEVDVGEVNNQIFLNNSGLGLYPAIVHLREGQQARGVSRWPAALWATLRALIRYRLLTIRVRVQGQELLRRTPIVFVGNNQYSMEGLGVGKRSSLQDGELCLYIPHPQGRLKLLWFSLRAFFGSVQPSDEFDAHLSPEFSISSSHRSLKISLDGEVTTLATPLHYRIRPAALRVIVPAPDEA